MSPMRAKQQIFTLAPHVGRMIRFGEYDGKLEKA